MNQLFGSHPAEILQRFLIRIQTRLNVSDVACFVVDDPFSTPANAMPDKAYIVSFEGTSFNNSVDQTSDYLVETAYVNVTCFNRLSAIDETLRAGSLLSKNDVNLFEMKRRVLLALVNWRLNVEGMNDIEIASTVKATRCGKPQYMETDSGSHGAFLPLTFSVSYAIDVCNGDYNV